MANKPTQAAHSPETCSAVLKAAKHFPVVTGTGARQVGKTMLLQEISVQRRGYVSLGDPLFIQSCERKSRISLK